MVRHPLSRRLRGDAGTSLLELLVIMIVVGVLGTLLLRAFVAGTSAATTAERRGFDAQQVRTAMDTVTRALRTAADPDGVGPVRAVQPGSTGQDVTFYANVQVGIVDPAPPDRVRLWVDGSGVLREQVWDGQWDATHTAVWPALTRERVVLRGVRVDVPAGDPRAVFTYLQRSDTTPAANGTTTTTVDVVSGALSDSLTGARTVEAVEVWLSAGKSGADPVTAVSRVTLLNAQKQEQQT